MTTSSHPSFPLRRAIAQPATALTGTFEHVHADGAFNHALLAARLGHSVSLGKEPNSGVWIVTVGARP